MTGLDAVRFARGISPRQMMRPGLVWLSAGLTPGLTVLAGLVLARSLGPDRYGLVAYFFSLYGLGVLAGAMGLTTQATTSVAREIGSGRSHQVAATVQELLIVRVASLALLLVPAALVSYEGNQTALAAVLVAALSLLAAFFTGVVQGLGRATLASVSQLAQATTYLGLVFVWVDGQPARVYLSFAVALLVPLATGILASRRLFARRAAVWSKLRSGLPVMVASAGPIYLTSLFLAPYSSVAVLALGHAGRFGDAGLLSVGLTLALGLSTATAIAMSALYHPRLCRLVAQADTDQGVQDWVGRFFRTFFVLGCTATMVLAFFSDLAVNLLFTSRYEAAATIVLPLAVTAGLSTIGNFAVWTLIALGDLRAALFGGALQLLVLLGMVGLALLSPDLPLSMLGAGHGLAAASGLGVWLIALHRRTPRVLWCGRSMVASLVCAAGIAAVLHSWLAVGTADHGESVLGFLCCGFGVLVGAALPFILELSPRPWPGAIGPSGSPSASVGDAL